MNTMFFNAVSCFFVCAGLIIALILAINVIFHRQSMKIMNIVWVLTGLWGHYFALFAYYTFGVRKDNMVATVPMENMKMDRRYRWRWICLKYVHNGSLSLCRHFIDGAGCTLADIIGEWFTYWVPLQIGGMLIAGSWALRFCIALILGVSFNLLQFAKWKLSLFVKLFLVPLRPIFFHY